jgi:electron transport complex protein RnfC
MHLGAPAEPVKSKGDEVAVGELVGKAASMISANVHSPVAGKIKRIAQQPLPGGRLADYAEIDVDAEATREYRFERKEVDLKTLEPDEILSRIRDAGIVGMGGATFPTDVKLKPPPSADVDVFVVNGAECEPYLSCDHRLMVERATEIFEGIRIVQRAVGFKHIYIGIEENKSEALSTFDALATAESELSVDVVPLHVKYPQGAEKMLINAITGRVVPAGSLPFEVGAIVSNVATLYAVYEAVYYEKPLIDRVVTVAGPGVTDPRNLKVPLGTTVERIAEYCGGPSPENDKVIMGGPLMGVALPSLDYSVAKGTSGLLFFTNAEVPDEMPCIRCGTCVNVCPMNLMPLKLAAYAKAERFEEAKGHSLADCFECGCCAYSCPSKIRLVAWIRYAKNYVRVHKL